MLPLRKKGPPRKRCACVLLAVNFDSVVAGLRSIRYLVAADQPSGNPVEVQSNSIEIKIVAPDPAWQAAELANIREMLDHSPPAEPDAPDQPRQAAMARLRYLGTESAALEMARRLRGDGGYSDVECMFGLIASPHRDAGLAEMNNLFGTPDFPISGTFLMTMAILPLDPTATPESLRANMFRYTDSGAWPQVAGKVTENVGTWACEPQDTMLAYALRVDPETARPLLERAIAARGPQDNACRHMLFTDVGALQQDPILEELAIKSLTDPDPEVAQAAACYLGIHGSAAAEQPLWERYQAWSSQWRGREQEFRFTYAARNPNTKQEGIGEQLATALASGLGWLSDETKLRHIVELGVGQNIPRNIDRDLQVWSEQPRTIACNPTGSARSPISFAVAQYDLHSIEDLKTKLGQFPAGSKFLWSSFDPNTSAECDKAFADASQFAARNGIRLQRVANTSSDAN